MCSRFIAACTHAAPAATAAALLRLAARCIDEVFCHDRNKFKCLERMAIGRQGGTAARRDSRSAGAGRVAAYQV